MSFVLIPSAQTCSSSLPEVEGARTSAQRMVHVSYVSLPSRSIRLWVSIVVNALASPSRVGSIGLCVPRLPSIAGGKSHMGNGRNAAPRRIGGIKPQDMQVAGCVAIPILVAGLSYKRNPVFGGRASSGEVERKRETGLASILAHRCISGTRNTPVLKRDHDRKRNEDA